MTPAPVPIEVAALVRFCEANGIKAKTYYYWLRKLRMRLCEQTVVALPMVMYPFIGGKRTTPL